MIDPGDLQSQQTDITRQREMVEEDEPSSTGPVAIWRCGSIERGITGSECGSCWAEHRNAHGDENDRADVMDDFPDCNRDRGKPRGLAPPTPPDMRVRIRRFGGLSYSWTVNLGIPSESK
jgi:hypothetical protein